MKRTARRTLGVIIGLALGWYAAGVLMPWPAPVQASAPHAAESAHGAAETGDSAPHDQAADAAKLIATDLDQPWYLTVVYGALVLFTIAGVVGYTGWFRAEAPAEDDDDH